ncbi:hypothetical protein BH10ACT7_BH10ACT7_07970 [soil metagenome]
MNSRESLSIPVMDVHEEKTERDPVRALAWDWHVASTITVGPPETEWFGEAVCGMARAMIERRGLEQAVARLAVERASKGITLPEGLDDLAVLFQVARASDPPYDLGARFAAHWTEATLDALFKRTCVDSLTGLATHEFLAARLREVYAEDPPSTAERRCLVVVDPATAGMNGWQKLIRTSSVADIVTGIFRHGQTNAVIPSGRFVSLVHRNAELETIFTELRVTIAQATLTIESPPVRLWIEPLPSTAPGAERLLLDL